jgi:hypothetical protein
MTQKTKKAIGITATIFGLLIIAVVSYMLILTPSAEKTGEFQELYGDGALQAGRYYLHGDKSSFYYEVFEDQTMQLGGGDPAEFVLLFSGHSLKDAENWDEWSQENLKQEAEWRSIRRSYVVLQYNWPDDKGGTNPQITIIFDAKTVEEVVRNGGGRGLTYIDERTISPGGDGSFKLIRID